MSEPPQSHTPTAVDKTPARPSGPFEAQHDTILHREVSLLHHQRRRRARGELGCLKAQLWRVGVERICLEQRLCAVERSLLELWSCAGVPVAPGCCVLAVASATPRSPCDEPCPCMLPPSSKLLTLNDITQRVPSGQGCRLQSHSLLTIMPLLYMLWADGSKHICAGASFEVARAARRATLARKQQHKPAPCPCGRSTWEICLGTHGALR